MSALENASEDQIAAEAGLDKWIAPLIAHVKERGPRAPKEDVGGTDLERALRSIFGGGSLAPRKPLTTKPMITLGGFAGTGKALADDQLVQTPTGPRPIASLQVGDLVFGGDGKPTRVLGVYPQGERQSWRVTFRDGATVECDDEHLWTVWTMKTWAKRSKPTTLTLREMREKGFRYNCGLLRYRIPLAPSVEYRTADLPIDPYTFGALLGDGTNFGQMPTLCTPDIDAEIVERVRAALPPGMDMRVNRAPACPQYRIVDTTQRGNRFTSAFRDLDLAGVLSPQRFIPRRYLHADTAQRWALLRGLMDTDGSCVQNRTSFSTSSERLARDITLLVQSLGGTAIPVKLSRGGEWQVNVKTFECPFLLARKAARWRFSAKNPPSRCILSAEPSRVCGHTCIKVEAADGLFLTEGYVVTHNTTLIGALAKKWQAAGLAIAFVTFSGKASTVLERSLARNGVVPDYVGTIHRLIYKPDVDEDTGRMRGWIRADDLNDYDLIVVDEASMVPTTILADLLSYDLPILAVGDHGQLPPVGEDAGVMAKPDLRLEKIHRQAADNPVIAIASAVRMGKPMKEILAIVRDFGDPRARVVNGNAGLVEALRFTSDPTKSFLITYTNATRTALNAAVRRTRGIDPASPPQKGESVICLRNNYDLGPFIANGMRGIITSDPVVKRTHWTSAEVEFDNGSKVTPDMLSVQFGRPTFARWDEIKAAGGPLIRRWDDVKMLADYGYAITCHKSQGSQAENVAVYLENSLNRMEDDEKRRWTYTALTRSSENLLLVSP